MATFSKASVYLPTSFSRSLYSRPYMRWVGWTTRVFTLLSAARSRAWVMLSMATLSRFWMWSMMIWLVKPRRTLQSGKVSAIRFSMAPMVRRRLSLKLVPKLATSSSRSPMPS